MATEITMKTLIITFALAFAAAAAHAHGDHAASAPGAVMKEQKPWGIAGERRAAKRTIEIRMSDDMRFTPSRIEVRQGETVRLFMRNSGAVLHELVIGTQRELEEHAALMQKFPDMAHDEPYMAHVKPGQTGEIVWTFNRAGEFDFACLIAGHFQAGMRGKFIVRAR
jgi:uncharacterized cupredoxin-like copper-binding protein